MYSNCDIASMHAMGINVEQYLNASTGEQRLLLKQLRQAALVTVHDNEQRIAQIDYLRTKINQT
ncbi:hypothetical protein [Lacticaseibacillus porcinae]|uniref:hypothetical protein n=1 Tax=Lacticaseibacillus porcinae TaxID=1123687 RepID=UPI000F78972C|nr:hypothetical protein [Lacticaseibacillus porcinae]